ncbi:melanopsin-like [Haliotis rubra]|uniref:melanopsin-like n=1 Tax=Haliotis rubra TaxID=36100 RepID=UPI001EE4F632|nr:melanopsin-like [Haliotis rubra]XP_046585171.1 melanopsin-like [Haliotis rubra]XP_046585172.1 melanopsin-like [Haliotis rubra]XP_046585173.1 melanopsin-like [Haliotis rubra]XP_046585174.1 melanopsin-like [Haliotis rubra]XP_046585175.1 melanopsin-like [Haliotis rubra]XP_046585176.1 melanopsin-like [Haliotis rubra]XP_046585177.1 melanopsin-like [Haliotis rubra]XP_046585178.1 melanopsin-like [Haliotis rubra]XP_046585179.1 melanopsin-like [Haliotis rubra]
MIPAIEMETFMTMNTSTPDSLGATSLPSDNTSSSDYDYKHDGHALFKWHGSEILFLVIIFLVGTVGNGLVLYIYHIRWRRSNFTFFIKVLAAIDFFNCVVSVPMFFVMTVDGSHSAFAPLCKTTSFIAMSNAVSSAVVLTIVAFDRNRKIHRPLKHEIRESTTRQLVVIALAIGLIVSVPGVFTFGSKRTRYSEDGRLFNITWCFFSDEKLGTTLVYAYVGVLGAVFMVIMVAMSTLYFSIWRALRVHLQRRESLGCHRSSIGMTKNGNYYRSQKTTAKLFFIITVAFFVSYFPYYISIAVFLIDDYKHQLTSLTKAFADIAKLAPLASCAINPLIYSISSARFRREIAQIFKRAGRTSEAKKKILFNSLNSQEQAGQLKLKHSRSQSGSSFGLKSVSNDQIVFGKINIPGTDKQSYS